MKLVSLNCPKCGAELEVNSELNTVVCNYCGNKFAIDTEIVRVQHDLSEAAGYNFEMGRIRAQEEAQEKKRKEEEDRARRESFEQLRIQIEEQSDPERISANRKARWLFILGAISAAFALALLILSKTGKLSSELPIYLVGGSIVVALICAILIINVNKKYRLNRNSDWVLIMLIAFPAVIILVANLISVASNKGSFF